MATTAQMIGGGIALVVDTVLLAYMTFVGDKVFNPITQWAFSFQYSKQPPFDPGLMTWVFPVFYWMIVCMWFALVFALYLMATNRAVYGYTGEV